MKKVLLSVIIILLIPSTGYSQDKEKICSDMSMLAGEIMKIRQANVPIVELKKAINNNENASNKKEVEIANSMIDMAYTRPRFSSEENQQNEIVDFQNEIYLYCITNLNK